MWSSIGEGIGLFLAANIVINLHRPDLLLPAMALVVGLHFLPIAFAAGFRPFYVLGLALIAVASSGFIVGEPTGGSLAGTGRSRRVRGGDPAGDGQRGSGGDSPAGA